MYIMNRYIHIGTEHLSNRVVSTTELIESGVAEPVTGQASFAHGEHEVGAEQ